MRGLLLVRRPAQLPGRRAAGRHERALDELAAAGLATLIISGGEPFLRDDLPDIVAYAKRTCGIKSVTVLSNGTCLDR